MKDTLEKDYMSVYAGSSRTLNSFFSKAYEWYRSQMSQITQKDGSYHSITCISYKWNSLSIRTYVRSITNLIQQLYLVSKLNTG